MARMTSSARRAAMRGRERSKRVAVASPRKAVMPVPAKARTKQVAEPEAETVPIERPEQRKRAKAARAAMRSGGKRHGFAKALRAEVRTESRASVQRSRKRRPVSRNRSGSPL